MKTQKEITMIDFMAIIVIIGAICIVTTGIQYWYKLASLVM